MRNLARTIIVLGTLAMISGSAWAHPHAYVAGNDVICVSETEDSDGIPDVGCVRFAVGEVQILDPVLNNAVLTISDDVLSPVGGYWCQDWNDNGICGESDPLTGAELEPSAPFCGSTEVVSGGTPNWDQGFELIVFINGPVFGNPVFSECLLGLSGNVDHS